MMDNKLFLCNIFLSKYDDLDFLRIYRFKIKLDKANKTIVKPLCGPRFHFKIKT